MAVSFKGAHFPQETILMGVRWYLAYPLSYCHVEELIVEQDHRAVKRPTWPMLGFKVFHTTRRTLVGIELMHMLKKKQLEVGAEDEGRTVAELSYSLAV